MKIGDVVTYKFNVLNPMLQGVVMRLGKDLYRWALVRWNNGIEDRYALKNLILIKNPNDIMKNIL